jgi:hypothetical protein
MTTGDTTAGDTTAEDTATGETATGSHALADMHMTVRRAADVMQRASRPAGLLRLDGRVCARGVSLGQAAVAGGPWLLSWRCPSGLVAVTVPSGCRAMSQMGNPSDKGQSPDHRMDSPALS